MLFAFAIKWHSQGTGGMGGSGSSIYENVLFCRASKCPTADTVTQYFLGQRNSCWGSDTVVSCLLLFENVSSFYVVRAYQRWMSDMSSTRAAMVGHGLSLAVLPMDLAATVQSLEGDHANWVAAFRCSPNPYDKGVEKVSFV